MTESKPSWIGRTLNDRYKIEEILGQGGMAGVYKATDPNLERTVAIKIIHEHMSRDADFIRRFKQEARAIARLHHPKIIQVHDFSYDGDVLYMVMDYLPGNSLQDRLNDLKAANQELPLTQILQLMIAVCDAIAYAHESGLIHRDIKTANVMFDAQGQPVIVDFGLTKLRGSTEYSVSGSVTGSASYMSPEQVRGQRVDERTDIYTLGVLLFRMFTGQRPFNAESSMGVSMKHLEEAVPDIRQYVSEVPDELAALIYKALEKDPADRFQTVDEMAVALQEIDWQHCFNVRGCYPRLRGLPVKDVSTPELPLNLCLVIDQSNSMRGARLEQVKSATKEVIAGLKPGDTFSVVTFNNRAQTILPAQKNLRKAVALNKVGAIMAEGGTEILQGLTYGLAEIHRNLSRESVNHLILLTDGHTYGDEEDCLALASQVKADGIAISGMGIGNSWNDGFLDNLASLTGGVSAYIDSPAAIKSVLQSSIKQMGAVFAERMRLQVKPELGVEFQSAWRCAPDVLPLATETQPLRLGALSYSGSISVLLEFLVPPSDTGSLKIARMNLTSDTLELEPRSESTEFDFSLSVSKHVPTALLSPVIAEVLDKLNLYRTQEKAWESAESGNLDEASRQLKALAKELLSRGQKALAQTALVEAERLKGAHKLSDEGRKRLKYGTRALMIPQGELPNFNSNLLL